MDARAPEEATQINIDTRSDGERFHIRMEQPVLLRLPEEDAAVLRQQMAEGKVDLVIEIPDGMVSGTCRFNGRTLCATLVKLPCVVETHKTYDDVALYKTGDVGQAIVVHAEDNPPKIDEFGRLKSGLTPPTNRIVGKFKKPFTEAERRKMRELQQEITNQGGIKKSEEDDN